MIINGKYYAERMFDFDRIEYALVRQITSNPAFPNFAIMMKNEGKWEIKQGFSKRHMIDQAFDAIKQHAPEGYIVEYDPGEEPPQPEGDIEYGGF